MVLRGVDPAAGTLRFHTDRRAPKVAVIAAAPRVAVAGYDPAARLQLRLSGTATVLTVGTVVDTAWAATSAYGRRAYRTIDPPGTPTGSATSGLPEAPSASPDLGRIDFALMIVVLDRIEWLHLSHDGHRRAAYRRAASADWTGTWLVP